MPETMKGKFSPANPGKYRGNRNNIIFRSSWEMRCMKFFDLQENVLWWSSEETIVPYRDPASRGMMRRYYPDFTACIQTREGQKIYMIEIKPYSQTVKPSAKGGRRTKKFLREAATWSRNEAKWEAARKFCRNKGWDFVVWTEKNLFGK